MIKKEVKDKNKNQQGYLVLFSFVFFAVMMVLSVSLINYTSINIKGARQSYSKNQAIYLAQAGIDKAVSQLNTSSSYTGESNTVLGSGVYTISVSTVDSNTKRITATGYLPNSSSPTARETVSALVSISDTNIAFAYGVQAGAGGFSLTGGSSISGNVYSNADIDATSGVTITGSATAANPPAVYADQANNSPTPISTCSSSVCVTFGDASATQDFAQSFILSDAQPLSSVDLYIKKVSTPGDLNVRIVNDSSGSPGTETVMSATLSASAVGTSFAWETVSLPADPVLDSGRTYWLVLDGGNNSSRYYIIGANSSYANGTGKIGRYTSSWSNTSPTGRDGYFELNLGGGNSMIGGNTYVGGVTIGTNSTHHAKAYNVMGASVSGTIYCQTSSYNNKSCNTSQAVPSQIAMPILDSNIDGWKDEAEAGGVISGDYNVGWAGATLGPKKIIGDLNINGGGIFTVSGTLWITGDINLSGGGQLRLASSYGSNDGAIIADGNVSLTGGSSFAGSGTSGSYPFVISTSACPSAPGCGITKAINLSGGAGTVALIAQDGEVSISGGSSLKAVVAKKIIMDSGAGLTYDSALMETTFSAGTGGAWEFVPGSYVVSP